MRADISRATPQMQRALGSVVGWFSPEVTSVMHGEHAKGSAHYQGRAVDVGAFGGVPVGYNAPTWQAIANAIMSRQFSKIGTIAAFANNPQVQQFARQYGVEVFEDEGSGPHVHFQVGA